MKLQFYIDFRMCERVVLCRMMLRSISVLLFSLRDKCCRGLLIQGVFFIDGLFFNLFFCREGGEGHERSRRKTKNRHAFCG